MLTLLLKADLFWFVIYKTDDDTEDDCTKNMVHKIGRYVRRWSDASSDLLLLVPDTD